MTLLAGHDIAVVDTETTGFSPSDGTVIVEVAVVRLVDARVREELSWSSLVDIGRPIPPDATAVHGITTAMLAGAPKRAEVARRLREACGDRPLAFHNAPFDLPFLAAMLRRAGLPPLWNPVVDTLGLARGLFGPGSNSLGALAARLGLPRETAHRALGDALTTARLFLALAGRWEAERGVRSLAELAALSQDAVRVTGRR